MTNQWERQRIPRPLRNPQDDWQRSTERSEAWTPVVLRFPVDLAGTAAEVFCETYNLPCPERDTEANSTTLQDDGQRGGDQQDNDRRQAFKKLLSAVRLGPETIKALVPPRETVDDGGIEITIMVATEQVDEVIELASTSNVDVVAIGASTPASFFSKPQSSWFNYYQGSAAHLKGAHAIVAVIDDGIAFANQRFRRAARETRFEMFWSMDPNPGAPAPGRRQPNLWMKDEIDKLLRDFDADEEAIYRATGLLDPARPCRQPLWQSLTHGTHVLDIATGADVADPEAGLLPIIAVQLPSATVIETSGSPTAHWLALALEKIKDEANELGKRIASTNGTGTRPPLLLNFSFGVFAGPKDGSGLVEETIKNFIEDYRKLPGEPECHVILPAGNSLLSRTNARLTLGERNTKRCIDWQVLPDDKTASFVHIWLPPAGPTKRQIAVKLIPPYDGPERTRKSKLGYRLDWVKDGAVHARLYHQETTWSNQPREWVVIAIRPTASDDGRGDLVPPGLWRIEIENKRARPGTEVELMIQRDDSLRDYRRRGRQSYFEHPAYQRYDRITGRPVETDNAASPVKREGTLSAYASQCIRPLVRDPGPGSHTHQSDVGDCDPITVGGYTFTTGHPAYYTSSGPVASGRQGPNLAAASETSLSLPGQLAAGTYNESVVLQRGTSIAAPAFLRALAEEIAQGGSRASLIEKIRQSERNAPSGPHGHYRALQPEDVKRMGVGRLTAPEPPPHRRRITS